jgi:putative salt-induced outer membrane protein
MLARLLLSALVLCSISYAEPTGIEQEINEIDIQIKRLQDRKRFLEAQLVAEKAEDVVDEKAKTPEEAEAQKLAAKEKEEKLDLGFTTHAEVGYIKTTGNTDTETYNMDIKLKKEWEKHILTLAFLKIYGEENGEDNKDKTFTELNYYYKFTDRFAFDYMAAYKEDKFSGFDYQFYTGPGLVYKVVDEEKHTLFAKLNSLYSRDQVEDTRVDANGNEVSYPYPSGSINQHDGYSDEYVSYKAQILYTWQLAEKTKFVQDLRYRSQVDEAENYFIYSKSSLEAKISDIFSAGISYQVDYVNEAAEGKNHTDKTTMFNLIIDY